MTNNFLRGCLFLLPSVLLVLLSPGCQSEEKLRTGEPHIDDTSQTGYYIPRDLDDAVIEVDRMIKENERSEVLFGAEQDMVRNHRELGTWIKRNWGLLGGSRLAEYFDRLGIYHADDMAGIILSSYWRHLHAQPIDLQGQVWHYQEYRKKLKQKGVSQ